MNVRRNIHIKTTVVQFTDTHSFALSQLSLADDECLLLLWSVPDQDFRGPGALRKMRPPVQILKFLAVDVQLFTLKFYNNITKTSFEFVIKRLHCALSQVHCSCSCRLQVAATFDTKLSPFHIFEIWVMM